MTKSWSILRDHIYYNMCDEDDNKFNWFMTWMAHIVQKPNEKYGMAVVVTGAEGSGKNTVFNHFRDMLPFGTVKASTPYYNTYGNLPNVNPYTRFAILDEWTEEYHLHHESKLKHLITESTWMYEAKGIDAVEYNNYLRLALLTSEDWVVPGCDRRYVKFEMSDDAVGDHNYFKALYTQMSGGLEAFKEELENWVPPQKNGWDCLREQPQEDEPYAVFDLETRGVGDYHPALMIQSESRIHRASVCTPVFTYKLKDLGDTYITLKMDVKAELSSMRTYGWPATYGPDNWSAQELIHCVDSNGTAYLAEQNNWNESDVMSWYEDATTTEEKNNDNLV